MGGYLAGGEKAIDTLRSYASSFIFTTAVNSPLIILGFKSRAASGGTGAADSIQRCFETVSCVPTASAAASVPSFLQH